VPKLPARPVNVSRTYGGADHRFKWRRELSAQASVRRAHMFPSMDLAAPCRVQELVPVARVSRQIEVLKEGEPHLATRARKKPARSLLLALPALQQIPHLLSGGLPQSFVQKQPSVHPDRVQERQIVRGHQQSTLVGRQSTGQLTDV